MCTEYTQAPLPHQASFTFCVIKSLGQQQTITTWTRVGRLSETREPALTPEWVRVLDAAPNPLRVSVRVLKLIIMVTIESYAQ
jgi:hypothetical protein